MNQQTDLTLKSPHVTFVSRGEIDEVVQPGTTHTVQTAAAIAAAIGTEFDVREVRQVITVVEKKRGQKKKIRKKVERKTIIVVVEGALVVETPKGSVTVKTNQKTSIVAGEAPLKPSHINASKAVEWKKTLPPPLPRDQKQNIALDANGGQVITASSENGALWSKNFVNDGRLDRGWATATGKIAGQWVKIQFKNQQTYNIAGVIIDPAATGGLPSTDDAKDFRVYTSLTTSADSSFALAYQGTLSRQGTLQSFSFPRPEPARYVKIEIRSNYGGNHATLAEVEVISPPQTVVPPSPTATPTARPTHTPVPTSTSTPTATPTSTSTPTPTSTPTATPTSTATPTPTPTLTATPTATPTSTPTTPPFPTPPPIPTATPTPCVAVPCFK
jgi:hypothetical protein